MHQRPRLAAPAKDVHRMSREHDCARVLGLQDLRVHGQAGTAGPGWEPARGRAWGGVHCWKPQAKNGVIRLTVVLIVVFSHPSSQPQGNVIQPIQSIVWFGSSVLVRAHFASECTHIAFVFVTLSFHCPLALGYGVAYGCV